MKGVELAVSTKQVPVIKLSEDVNLVDLHK